jgi:PAP2 superfamily
MPTYSLPPGAWPTPQAPLWGSTAPGSSTSAYGAQLMAQPSARAGLTPDWLTHPPASNTPDWLTHPPASLTPDWLTHPPASATPDWLTHPPSASTPDWLTHPPKTRSTVPLIQDWAGIDPPWVYANGPDALLAQGLRRTRDRIAPAADPRVAKGPPIAASGKAELPALWRWQRQFRVKAVVAEVLSRLVVQGTALWWVPAPAASMVATQIFTLPSLKGYNWSNQIDKVMRAAVEREERLPEILSQASDFNAYFDAVVGVSRPHTPHLSELLEVAWEVSSHVVLALKNAAAVWRPYQLSSAIHPVIATPGHGSLPSGHATVAALTACVYAMLLPRPSKERLRQLDRLARRIAFNRVVAGVHFPIDSQVGYALGAQIALAMGAGAAVVAMPRPYTPSQEPGSAAPPKAGPKTGVKAELREISKGGFAAPVTANAAAVKTRAATRRPTATAPNLALMWNATLAELAQLP